MEPVRSSRNRRVAEAIRLHRARRRAETGLTLLEGPHLLSEAIKHGAALRVVFVRNDDETSDALASAAGLETVRVTPAVMDRLASTQHPRGPVAVFYVPRSPTAARSLLVAWGVGDPGNVGTMIRSAAAFGLGFLAGPATADPWAPKVLRSGAGAHFHTGVERHPDVTVEGLRSRGFTVVASLVAGGRPPAVLRDPRRWAVLIGEEAAGLPPAVVEQSDLRVTIPMPGGIQSLNAAVAASLLAYEIAGGGARLPASAD